MDPWPPPPEQVGPYRLGRCLGRGGCGVVFAAHHEETGALVAVKLLRPDLGADAQQRARLRQEARILQRLRHPGVARLLGVEPLPGGGLALIMEHLDGAPLRERLRGGPLPLPAALRIAFETAGALACVHAEGVVHRDVKPENIMLVPDPGGGESARVLDFGVARLRDGALSASGGSATLPATVPGARLGTPWYMAPEQLLAARDVTGGADVFALGVVLYEMLTGEPPRSVEAVPTRAAPVPPSAGNAAVPAWLDRLIVAMLAYDPAARPTMVEVEAALRPAAAGRCPFPGLEPFGEDAALLYFGREAEVERASALLGGAGPYRRWLQLEGPSGSGKSSLLRAGLVPLLRRRGVRGGPRRLHVIVCRPGRQPLLDLAQALRALLAGASTAEGEAAPPLGGPSRGAPPGIGELLRRLEAPAGLRDLLREVAEPDEGVLLALDQLEELFVLAEPGEIARLDALLAAALEDQGPLHLVTTVRSDFLGHLGALPALERRLNDASRLHLLPLGLAGLREAVLGPCARAGLRCEPGLVERIVADSAGAGALPLLGHALRALYEVRSGDLLTLSAYERLGGVGGALGRATEELLGGLGEDGRERARRLLLCLVRTGRGLQDARQRRSLADAQAAAGGDEQALRVLRRLSGGRDPAAPPGAAAPVRLLVSSADQVELIHEALLVHMPALRRWIEEDRRLLERRDDLEAAAAVWQATGCPEDGLAQGVTLGYLAAQDLGAAAERLPALVSAPGRRYLEAGQRRAAAEAAAEAQRRRHQRRVLLIQRAAVVVLLVLSGLALGQTLRLASLTETALETLERTLNGVAADQAYISGTRETRDTLLRIADGALPTLARAAGGGWRATRVAANLALEHGDFARDYGTLPAAARHYEEALRALAAPGRGAGPAQVLPLRARCLLRLAELAGQRGAAAEALAGYEQVRTLLSGRDDPSSRQLRAEAAWRSAELRTHAGAFAEAERELRDAAAQLGQAPDEQQYMSFILYYEAALALERGDLAAARRASAAALSRQRPLVNENRGYAIYPWHQARLLAQQARIRARDGDIAGARASMDDALRTLEGLARDNGRHRRYQISLLAARRDAAEVALQAGDRPGAVGQLRAARAEGEGLLKDDPEDCVVAHELTLVYRALLDGELPEEERARAAAGAERLRARIAAEGRWPGDRHLLSLSSEAAPLGPTQALR